MIEYFDFLFWLAARLFHEEEYKEDSKEADASKEEPARPLWHPFVDQKRCNQGNYQTPEPIDDSADACRLIIADFAQVEPNNGSRAKLESEYEHESHNK